MICRIDSKIFSILLCLFSFFVIVFGKRSEISATGEIFDMVPWKSVLMNSVRMSPASGYVTLATIENGRPRARTVLFSGFIEGKDGQLGIAIKTSSLSRKITEASSPHVEIVRWLEDAMQQFRFSGKIDYNNPDHENDRKQLWEHLNPAAREQFFYNSDNGLDSSTNGPNFKEQTKSFHSHSSSSILIYHQIHLN